MLLLNANNPVEPFLASLRAAEHRVLFLDYDGTLAPFVADRNAAWPYPGVVEAIDRVMELGDTRVVVVTGRSCASVLSLLRTRRRPEIWASHGWEHLPQQANEAEATRLLDPLSRDLLDKAAMRLRAAGFGERLEEKPFSIAAHWRGLDEADALRIAALTLEAWDDILPGSALEVHRFDGGYELRVRGRNKGFAVNATLDALDGQIAAAFLGDDLTDEDAFAALAGRGLRVLVRPEQRETLADLWIRPPEELLEFLEAWRSHSSAA